MTAEKKPVKNRLWLFLLLVFVGGITCGRCADLQRACLTDEFLAWQRDHKMLMVFTKQILLIVYYGMDFQLTFLNIAKKEM